MNIYFHVSTHIRNKTASKNYKSYQKDPCKKVLTCFWFPKYHICFIKQSQSAAVGVGYAYGRPQDANVKPKAEQQHSPAVPWGSPITTESVGERVSSSTTFSILTKRNAPMPANYPETIINTRSAKMKDILQKLNIKAS